MKRMCLDKEKTGKGFRVGLDLNPERRKGIFAATISELKEKTREKFRLKQKTQTLSISLVDGTEVEDDEYLQDLPQNSVIVIGTGAPRKETIHNPGNVFDHFLSLLRWSGGVDSVYKVVLEDMKQDFATKYHQTREDGSGDGKHKGNEKLSTRLEDPAWFRDLNTGAKNKEEFMFRNSQSRIRGYLARAEQQIKELGGTAKEKELLALVLDQFRKLLRENSFHGHLFQRTAEPDKRICDKSGLFRCEGRYVEKSCSYDSGIQAHEINPYQSRETRILFSTWNLDHGIERSRSIVPSLVEAVQLATRSNKTRQMIGLKLNVSYFYSLMFTRTNLRLVHIVCHDKQEHTSAKCDKKKYFV